MFRFTYTLVFSSFWYKSKYMKCNNGNYANLSTGILRFHYGMNLKQYLSSHAEITLAVLLLLLLLLLIKTFKGAVCHFSFDRNAIYCSIDNYVYKDPI